MSRLSDFRLLSFDVYGTLIDYESGILAALQPLLDANNAKDFPPRDLLKLHHELEAAQQVKTPEMPYHELLTTVYPQLAARLGFKEPSADESREFGQSIGKWSAFPDTVKALRRLSKYYKLVILSNVDRESFAASNSGPMEGFPFDLIITAQDVGSYKPDHRNFEYMLDKVRSHFGIEKHQVLQTAQSQFHDHHPAKELDIKSCWIVRPGAVMGNRDNPVFNWKFNELSDMADALEMELQGTSASA